MSFITWLEERPVGSIKRQKTVRKGIDFVFLSMGVLLCTLVICMFIFVK